MMGHRLALVSGDEYDCLFWRKVLCVFKRAGVSSKTKRRMRRRERREAKRELRGAA